MRRMKDSGIEYVGEIPEAWEIHPLYCYFCERKNRNYALQERNLLSLSYGNVVRKDIDTVGGLLPTSFNTYNIVEKGDIIIRPTDLQNDKRSLRTGLVKEKGIITSAYIDLKPLSGINSAYYRYLLHAYDTMKVFYNMGNGVRQGLNYDEFSKLTVFQPDASEQERIVDYLDEKCNEIDSLVEDIQSEIEILEEYKQSLIVEAVTKGLNKNTDMKESGVAWCPVIPSHWKVINPKALFKQRFDRASFGERQLTASQEYGIVFQDEYMEMTGNRVVTVLKDFSILKHVEPGDFVISMRSFQGGLEYSEARGCISSAYVMLIPNKELVYPRFYKWFFKSSKYINAIQSTSNLVRDGQAMRYANFIQVPLFLIPLAEQEEISDYLDDKISEINSVLKTKTEQIDILSDYKRAMIFEFVTGKKEAPAV